MRKVKPRDPFMPDTPEQARALAPSKNLAMYSLRCLRLIAEACGLLVPKHANRLEVVRLIRSAVPKETTEIR
jgi:hypothetical protein